MVRIFGALSVLAAIGFGGYVVRAPSTTTSLPEAASTTTSPPSTSPAPNRSAGQPTEELQRGGIVRAGIVGELSGMNPYLIGADRSLLAIHHLVAASAFRLDPTTHDLVPGVVVALPTLGNGGLTINPEGTMTVRIEVDRDAFWSDARRVSGADFVRTYEVVQAHHEVVHPDIVAAFDRIVAGSLAIDGASVQFTLDAPTLDLAGLFAQLVPAHQVDVDSFLEAWLAEPWESAGPFVFGGTSGNVLTFVPNPQYRRLGDDGARLPYLDGIEVQLYESTELAVAALSDGAVDVVGAIDEPDLVSIVSQVEGVHVDVRRGPGWEQIGFQFGPGALATNAASVIDRAQIRRAVLAALDRAAIADAVHGEYGQAMGSIIELGWPATEEVVWDDTGDPGGRLVGVKLVLATTAGSEDRKVVTDLIVSQLGAAGMEVEVVTDEPGRFFGDAVLPGLFEVGEWAWVVAPGGGGVAGNMLEWFWTEAPAGLDFYRWSSHPDSVGFGSLIAGIEVLTSEADLRERLILAERELAESVPLIPLYADLNVGVAAGGLRGFSHSALPGGVLSSAGTWWLADQ